MNWKEARDLLDGKGKRRGPRDSVKIARNTYLERGRSFLPPFSEPPKPGSKYRTGYSFVNGTFGNSYGAAGISDDYPDTAIGLRLHNTYVAILTPQWTEFYTGGWPTKVTADRMCYVSGIYIGGDRHGWSVYLETDNGFDWQSGGHPFFGGIRISADASRLMKNQPYAPKHFSPLKTESGFQMSGGYMQWR